MRIIGMVWDAWSIGVCATCRSPCPKTSIILPARLHTREVQVFLVLLSVGRFLFDVCSRWKWEGGINKFEMCCNYVQWKVLAVDLRTLPMTSSN